MSERGRKGESEVRKKGVMERGKAEGSREGGREEVSEVWREGG